MTKANTLADIRSRVEQVFRNCPFLKNSKASSSCLFSCWSFKLFGVQLPRAAGHSKHVTVDQASYKGGVEQQIFSLCSETPSPRPSSHDLLLQPQQHRGLSSEELHSLRFIHHVQLLLQRKKNGQRARRCRRLRSPCVQGLPHLLCSCFQLHRG